MDFRHCQDLNSTQTIQLQQKNKINSSFLQLSWKNLWILEKNSNKKNSNVWKLHLQLKWKIQYWHFWHFNIYFLNIGDYMLKHIYLYIYTLKLAKIIWFLAKIIFFLKKINSISITKDWNFFFMNFEYDFEFKCTLVLFT